MNEQQEFEHNQFIISTDPEKLDLEIIHEMLSRTYWARGISREVVERSIQGALCYGIYDHSQNPVYGRLVGFGRVITDYATFAYLSDLFVIESHRGLGLSKWMVECIQKHPQLQNLRRWLLVTADAHGLYQQFGFKPLHKPEMYMEITKENPYTS